MIDGYYPQATLINDRSVTVADILLQGEKFTVNPSALPPDITPKEPHSLVIFPALVDLCSRSGEPGFEARETLTSLQNCARGGGFGRVALLPCQPIDRLAMADFFAAYVPRPFLLWGALTSGGQLCEFADLRDRVVGFAHREPLPDLLLLRRALEYLQPYQKTVLLLAQDSKLGAGVMMEGYYSLKLGLAGIPTVAETSALAAIINLVGLTRCPVHVMGISCAQSLPLLEQAKNEGLPLTASVNWTHLLWNTSHLSTFNPHLRLHPPLPNPQDQTQMIQGIKTGIIDAIAIDHCPYTYEEKMIPFEVTPPGTIGLQFAFPLLWANLVATNKLTPLELWQALRIKPAQILGIDPPAELFALLPEVTWQLNPQTSLSLSQNTVLWQQEIKGEIIPLVNSAP